MDYTSKIRSALQTQSFPTPSLPWTTNLTSRIPTPPLPSLIATAKARLLASDLTTPGLLDPSATASFPTTNPELPELVLQQDVPCQVLDVENLSLSRWEQVEELEAVARGEQTTGRRVVRLAAATEEPEYDNIDEGGGGGGGAAAVGAGSRATQPQQQQRRNATHRLVLQDFKGNKIYVLELRRIDKIGIGSTNIGEKIVLKKGTVVARGTMLLEPDKCVMLGGKVDAWQKAWIEGRMARLKEAVEAER
ncbi:RecQ mediated genome instability protein Rmi1 [Colletotrichum scovillei]|uniref:RecQ mediated genome instability protein Rmi1 n=1 Tax=Colletotrichum scovillei TaxID=1209932 RepID=A0A9P7U5I5_9PEZI|nr:RecQ mediated genome instability protein Rmi1 [Colletotrichum scovillei]KAF4775531.1 RecQ mediated genome instability protein Rmi1 [Colletotrichum scovillei]KAG7042634.1 RecQ mediated genome instability protein Rmi1 [Colletotrichum scovillei]KAG7043226.1 RecQ mediated genome instability protein Rmi1 [Colletotrichum scovillei]KAG7062673.1 RecQ mediated genome instability protein Rmi1 [Colletotrichum scovillei]